MDWMCKYLKKGDKSLSRDEYIVLCSSRNVQLSSTLIEVYGTSFSGWLQPLQGTIPIWPGPFSRRISK